MGLLLRGASVIDGTGVPARQADVLIEGDRIAAVSEPSGSAPSGTHATLDLDGLTLAPGFVDVHTHYDAQVLWDPDLTPSSSYGVTSVVMGSCGFGIAPTRPEHRHLIVGTLETVEDMPAHALEAGIRWDFVSFPDYLRTLEQQRTRLNVAAFIGHTPLRWYVMGEDAPKRSARPDEVDAMCRTVSEAMWAGAIGFATSVSTSHWGAFGEPVPSRLADAEEIFRLAEAMGSTGRGTVMVAGPGPELSFEAFSRLSERAGRPVTWAALLATASRHGSPMEVLDIQAASGGDVWPQIACRPVVMQLTMRDPLAFAKVPAFERILQLPRDQRANAYLDPAWREQAREQVEERWADRWQKVTVDETQLHASLRGRDLADLATEHGRTPFDLLLDLSVEEDLDTRFRVVLTNDDEVQLAALLQDDRTLLGLSDAGAHVGQLCDACFAPYLLSHWVREMEVLSLEYAVWRLTGHPAGVFQLPDRGLIREGFYADLVAFDPPTVTVTGLDRVADLPGGADRLVARSLGIEHVWVNGERIRTHGKDVPGVSPGSVIRPADANGRGAAGDR